MNYLINILIPSASAHYNDYYMVPHHMDGFGVTSGFGFFGLFLSLIFWALVIAAIIYLVKYIAKGSKRKEKRTSLEILKERYASGEINKEEFEEKKKDLGE